MTPRPVNTGRHYSLDVASTLPANDSNDARGSRAASSSSLAIQSGHKVSYSAARDSGGESDLGLDVLMRERARCL